MVICLLLILRQAPVGAWMQRLEPTLEALGLWGAVIFVLLYITATVLMLPGAPLTIAAGAVFGLGWGLAAVSLASTTGAAMAFLIARHAARRRVQQRFGHSHHFRAMDAAVKEGGWKIVALLRLSPAVPFNVQNYLWGLTGVGFWACILTSWAAMLPGTFLYVYLGYAGRAGVAAAAGEGGGRTVGEWVMLGVGLAATLAVTIYVTRLARRKLRESGTAIESLAQADDDQETAPNHEDPPVSKQHARKHARRINLLYGLGACAAVAATLLIDWMKG